MWAWISCNLLGRHREIVTSDRASIHLRCVRCGHRSPGWQLVSVRSAVDGAPLWPRTVVQLAPRQPS